MKANSSNTFRLRKYTWRSLLTFTGPLLMLAYYTTICGAFLTNPPENGIVATVHVHARWMYYSWFLLAILSLDWARAGLANVEAASLMYRGLAPQTAMELMWHTDAKWANPLWWLRAVRSFVFFHLLRRIPLSRLQSRFPVSRPSGLWTLLSLTTLLITVALPLSGLTMEIANVSVYTNNKVDIFGPNETTFNRRSPYRLPEQVFRNWQSGRTTTPSNGMLYAPSGTFNVSTTHFDTLARNYVDTIKVFAPPTVRELVVGRAWGLSANISCSRVRVNQLQMMTIHDPSRFFYTVNVCTPVKNGPCSPNVTSGNLEANQTSRLGVDFPLWFGDTSSTGKTENPTVNSYAVVADGDYQPSNGGPYVTDANHDKKTFDSRMRNRAAEDVTTAMLEFYWGEYKGWSTSAVTNASGQYQTAIHCDITSAVGHAILDPRSRTFSSFQRGKSMNNYDFNLSQQGVSNVAPPQILAAAALANGANYVDSVSVLNTPQLDYVWRALHAAINAQRIVPTGNEPDSFLLTNKETYAPLSSEMVLLAVYKLLGESVIALMDDASGTGWQGELRSMEPGTYLVAGTVSWIYVVVLLSCWAFVVSGSALWMLTWGRPRWAPSLDGFEMFKFGAQYPDQVNGLASGGFQGCHRALGSVPGMVGVLPGTGDGRARHLGFIGLSENSVGTTTEFTLDRTEAALTRIVV